MISGDKQMINAERHLNVEEFVSLVASQTGLSKRETRQIISAFCKPIGEELGEGHDITLRNVGRFRVAGTKSYWRTDLKGHRMAQKAFSRIYFSPSESVQKNLNKHLREGAKRAKKQSRP
jgi:nucleoid DNA-binding protein